MARHKCRACDGIYPDVESDGTLYFHACPEDHVIPGAGPADPPRRVPIPGRRNENVTVLPDGTVVQKAPGAGFDVV